MGGPFLSVILGGQQNVATTNQQASLQQQANASQQAGFLIPSQGQAPHILQQNAQGVGGLAGWTSPYVHSQTVYIMPNGTTIAAHDATPDQLDQIAQAWKEENRKKFLSHPVEHREAFLLVRRARAVEETMSQDNNFFVVNRTGYTSVSDNAITPTLADYENWHSDSLMDAIIND